MSDWVRNNYGDSAIGDVDYGEFSQILADSSYASAGLGILILIHSFYIHKKKIDSIRLCTDIAAVTAIFMGIFAGIAAVQPLNPTRTAVAWNLFHTGFCTPIIQICDFYLFYSRFMAIQRVRALQKWLIHFPIWFVVVIMWLPSYTVVPFSISVESPRYEHLNRSFLLANVLITIIYQCYFSGQCLIVLHKLVRWRRKKSARKLRLVGSRPWRGAVGSRSSVGGSRSRASSGEDRAAARAMNFPSSNMSMVSSLVYPDVPDVLGSAASDLQHQVSVAAAAVSMMGAGSMNNAPSVASTTMAGGLISGGGGAASKSSLARTPEGAMAAPQGGAEGPAGDPAFEAMEAERMERRKMSHRWLRIVRITAAKTIGHSVTSSVATLLLVVCPVYGRALWVILKLLGMHFWFNWRMENYLCPSKGDKGSVDPAVMTRWEREKKVMQEHRDVVAAKVAERRAARAAARAGRGGGRASSTNGGRGSAALRRSQIDSGSVGNDRMVPPGVIVPGGGGGRGGGAEGRGGGGEGLSPVCIENRTPAPPPDGSPLSPRAAAKQARKAIDPNNDLPSRNLLLQDDPNNGSSSALQRFIDNSGSGGGGSGGSRERGGAAAIPAFIPPAGASAKGGLLIGGGGTGTAFPTQDDMMLRTKSSKSTFAPAAPRLKEMTETELQSFQRSSSRAKELIQRAAENTGGGVVVIGGGGGGAGGLLGAGMRRPSRSATAGAGGRAFPPIQEDVSTITNSPQRTINAGGGGAAVAGASPHAELVEEVVWAAAAAKNSHRINNR